MNSSEQGVEVVSTWGFSFGFVALALLCVHFKWKLISCAVQHSAYQNETIPTVFFCPSNKIFSHYFKWLPRGAYSFQAHWKRGLIETVGLFNLETTMVSVLHKELEHKVEKLKHKTF